MSSAPVAPAARGRTHISTRALTRVLTAVAADALGVRPNQVSVGVADAAGRLELTVRVAQRALPLERMSTAPGSAAGVAGIEQVQHDIREAVSALTGTQIAGVTVSVTSSRLHTGLPKPPPRERENTMSASDKMKNAAEDLKGKAKEAAGKATNDDSKVAEGKADQASAKVKKAGEDVKDAFK